MKPVAMITGGNSGIGLATARKFRTEGYSIAICGRDTATLIEAESSLGGSGSDVFAATVDLSSGGEGRLFVAEAAQRFGRIDVLVNAAGFAACTPFENISADEFEKTYTVNMRGVFEVTQAVWPVMVEMGGGVVVNISSLAAVSPFPGFAAYGSSKAWVDLFTVAIANEGRSHGIRAYSVRPGAVETKMLRGLFPDFPAEQTVSPEAVAAMICQLVGEEFSYSSGQAINVTAQ